jgi:uncharacterized repeat protein (TIGR03803 family)
VEAVVAIAIGCGIILYPPIGLDEKRRVMLQKYLQADCCDPNLKRYRPDVSSDDLVRTCCKCGDEITEDLLCDGRKRVRLLEEKMSIFTSGMGSTTARGCMRAASAVLVVLFVVGLAIVMAASAQVQTRNRVLYSFTQTNGDVDNSAAGLVENAAGNFYGTTYRGAAYGIGTVFELTP